MKKQMTTHDASEHLDHTKHKGRLKRVQGQIDGIARMIDEKRYCPDILIQLRASAKALESIEAAILETHIQGCVHTAVKAKDEKDIQKKIDEIMKLFKR